MPVVQAIRPSREDLALIASATRQPGQLARLVVEAMVEERAVDVQLQREGSGYLIVLRVLVGEVIVDEREWAVAADDLDKTTHFGLLALYVDQTLQGHEVWRRRMNRRLASLGGAPISSPQTAPR